MVENCQVRTLEEQIKNLDLQLQAWKMEGLQQMEMTQRRVEEFVQEANQKLEQRLDQDNTGN